MDSDNPAYEVLLEYWREQHRKEQAADYRRGKILRFEGDNCDLPIAFEGCSIRFENPDGHIRLLLELREDATLESIKENWRIIKEWQRRLFKWQGPWTIGGKTGFLAGLDLLKEDLSYSEIADKLNDTVVKELTSYLAYEREFEKARHSFKTWGDFYLWRWWDIEGVSPSGLDHARELLEDMGMRKDDAQTWCDEILANLRAGEPPFLPDGGPITEDRVRETIRYWRKVTKGVGKTG